MHGKFKLTQRTVSAGVTKGTFTEMLIQMGFAHTILTRI